MSADYWEMDHMFVECRFDEVDTWLDAINVEDLTPVEIVTILAVSKPAEYELTRRDAFLARAEPKLFELLQDDARTERLLKFRR